MELNGIHFSFGLQHPENVLQIQTQRLCLLHYIQTGCFIIRTMDKTNSALNTYDIKVIYTKYSIRTVVITWKPRP